MNNWNTKGSKFLHATIKLHPNIAYLGMIISKNGCRMQKQMVKLYILLSLLRSDDEDKDKFQT